MIETLPVFNIRPDWANPVRESLEWKTNIMRSQIGVEQRASTRITARRRQEVPITAIGRDHMYYQQLLSIEPQGRYYVPAWFERARTIIDTVATDTATTMGGSRREFLQTQFVFLQGPQPHLYEIAEVDTATVNVNGDIDLTFLTPLAIDWPKSTPIYPCYSAIIESADATQFSRAGARIIQGTVKFLFDKPFDWTSALTPDMYLSQPVFELLTNEDGQQSGDFTRILGNIDGAVGIVTQIDLGGKAFPGFVSNNWIQGRPASEALRDLLYFLRGRQIHGWWVHPTDDFVVTQPMATADTFIQVQRCGVTDLGISSSRSHLRILLNDGTAIYREIVDGTAISDFEEQVNLTAAIGADIPVETVSNIRYISQGRLDQDLISLDHHTDQDGITEYNLGVRFLPEIRVATDWDPPALPDFTVHTDPCLIIDGMPSMGPP